MSKIKFKDLLELAAIASRLNLMTLTLNIEGNKELYTAITNEVANNTSEGSEIVYGEGCVINGTIPKDSNILKIYGVDIIILP